MPAFNQPLGFGRETVLATAKALPSIPANGPLYAMITVEGQPVRWRDDGAAPTAAIGMLIPVGATFRYDGDLAALRIIETAASASISVSYYARAYA